MNRKPAKTRRLREGGDRLVRLTNGSQYITQANLVFGIVQFGPKSDAVILTLGDAVDWIRDIQRFGVHRIHAELAEPIEQEIGR